MSASNVEDRPSGTSVRPQALMFSFLGIYLRGRDAAVSSGSIIDMFRKVGVSEDAVRATLSRMVKRELLVRHPRGRKMYFGLSSRAADLLDDGFRRMWETGAVNRNWDGSWTMVGFSLPDSRRSERHDLRSKLVWAGFGLLQNGLWIAPGGKDVADIVESLKLNGHVTVLHARAASPTEDADLIAKAFDTAAIAARYRSFLDRWSKRSPLPDVPDDSARQLLLQTDWLQLVRQDPHLPAEHLPSDWPAIRAEELFHALSMKYMTVAADHAGVLDEISVLPTGSS